MRRMLLIIATVLVLGAVNFAIAQKEELRSHGRIVLLELAPVDPRSLMQGDYMALRFRAVDEVPRGEDAATDGRIVVAIDERNAGEFVRVDDGQPLAPNEALLRYRIRNDEVRFATNAFFFQEGHADTYASARYGEFRVSDRGDMLLTRMRDADLKPVGEASYP